MLFARIAGIKNSNAFAVTMLDALGITEHADKRVENYSGGTKRKLAVGLAFLRNPEIIFLGKCCKQPIM